MEPTQKLDIKLLKAELQRDEGMRLKPYKDTVGKLTIGIGRNLDDVGITEQEALYLLDNDIVYVTDKLDKKLSWWRGLSGVRQRVLVNMAFNLGMGTLLTFKNTLELIRLGKYLEASKAMLQSRWATQVGARAIRLSNMMRDNK